MAFAHRNELARQLRALHQPGTPILLTNCYDAATAAAVVANPATKAVATASYAIAAVSGVTDADLTLEDNLAGIRRVAKVVDKAGRPLTADLQDGYEDVAASVVSAIEAGAVGVNIEDENHAKRELRSIEDAVARIGLAVAAARDAGVPDFCINARTDVIVYGGSIDDAIQRGKAFLKAGALTVFVWGGPSGRGLRDAEIKRLVDSLGGMVNVKMNLRPGSLNAGELANIGVARVSIGPELFMKAMAGFNSALEDLISKM
ncbi:Putative pyruvate/Phosphoenolpyruvate kinase-like domain superfamily, ICL/PEPM [Septoria linicola]|uniref:Pyruvate/Phosphoenolpyruvate kinase-like domain superfamily, ICL/PEPM n=1 Tax=Septoria linicola TaxID=215465 RepID=A0A9Q9ATA6_9PEZI|nr:putative pyruvate/Phosphoenolpyruvate kinase-like domain superfamily, ICL/PEPM [Septoria linicola]USW55417.1 Putative pyruvate/Phosphoenolpyruvate kinase-like domain superfamily, ICL/PEPM [Septoria linicola]